MANFKRFDKDVETIIETLNHDRSCSTTMLIETYFLLIADVKD